VDDQQRRPDLPADRLHLLARQLGRRALADGADPGVTPMERFEAIWTRILESFAANRPVWAASFEMLAQVDQAPEVRAAVADAQEQARLGLATLFHQLDPALDGQTARVVGSFHLALLSGVMAQWLIDPDRAPSARDLAQALRTVAADLDAAGAASRP
jgi:BetI-type transcriptional repressor, C-terminal